MAFLTDTKDFAMSFFAADLCVVLLSTHLSLVDAIKLVKKDNLVHLIRLTDRELSLLLGRKPKIAVAGVNPHASEGGMFGTEEQAESGLSLAHQRAKIEAYCVATDLELVEVIEDAGESANALDLAGGDLPMAEALARLGTGIYVSNLWYLNYSDRNACRMTGMTRFATFWVENGKIQAPLNVMRFDDSAYRVLGENLLALTAERDMIIDSSSYGERSTLSARLPGALVKDFALTL